MSLVDMTAQESTARGTSSMVVLDAHRLLDCVEDAILVLEGTLSLIYANAAVSEFLEPAAADQPATFDPGKVVHPDDLEHAIGVRSHRRSR